MLLSNLNTHFIRVPSQYVHRLKEKIDEQRIESQPEEMIVGPKLQSNFSEAELSEEIDLLVKKVFEYNEIAQHLNEEELNEWILLQDKRILLLEQELEISNIKGQKEKVQKLLQAKNFLQDVRIRSGHHSRQRSQQRSQQQSTQRSAQYLPDGENNTKKSIIDRIDRAINKSIDRERIRSISQASLKGKGCVLRSPQRY